MICSTMKQVKEVTTAICYRVRQYLSEAVPVSVDVRSGSEHPSTGSFTSRAEEKVQRVHIMVTQQPQTQRFWQIPEGTWDMRTRLIFIV